MPKKKEPSPSGLTAAVYARYSSHAQNDASIEQQVDKCTTFALANRISIVETYADRAVSGRSDKRPEFQRMMRDAGKRKFDCVIAWKSNRMGRNMLEAMLNDAKLTESGIRCLYVEEDFGDSAAGRFALRNMMNVNQFYSENMAEDIQRGMMDNARQCKVNGLVPLGYKRGQDGRYEIDEPKAAIVREIFSRIAADETLVDIGTDLNRRGIQTSAGGEWNKNSFRSMTKNEKYIGVYTYADVRVEDGIPPIIDKGTFALVQEKIRRRSEVAGRRHEDEEYLLSGKLFCGLCGAPMTGVSGTSKNGEAHRYYICRSRRVNHSCTKENVRREFAEQLIAQQIRMHVLQDDVIEWIADSVIRYQDEMRKQSKLSFYQDKLVETRRAIDNIVKAIESGVISSALSERLNGLEEERRDLESRVELEKITLLTVTRDQIIYYMESFKSGDISDREYQKRLITSFLTAAYLYDDHLKIVFSYDGGKNSLTVPVTFEEISEGSECSFNDVYAPPYSAETNTNPTIYMIRDVFVLSVSIR